MSEIQVQSKTDIGRKRKINQDFVFASDTPVGLLPNLFLLADGMGGHKAGDYASSRLVEEIVSCVRETKSGRNVPVLDKAIKRANLLLWNKSQENEEYADMGSTLVASFIDGDTLTAANVGDSRLYVISPSEGITRITKDHSLVEELVSQGKMKQNSPEYMKNRHIITRAVGTEKRVDTDYFEVTLSDGDYVLLCSDGLTTMVDDDTIFTIVTGGGSLRYKVCTLIDAANENGGMDNIAVILVKYSEGGTQDA